MKRRRLQRRTAIHEAGHAILALAVCYQFENVVIVENDDDVSAMIRNIEFRRGEDEIIRVLLGGIMAVRFTRKRWSRLLFNTARDDIEKVGQLLSENNWSESLLRWNVNSVSGTLSQHWFKVEKIADHFFEFGEVSWSAAKSIWDAPPQQGAQATARDVHPDVWEPLVGRVLFKMKYPQIEI